MKWDLSTASVGDRITISSGHGQPYTFRTVAKVSKTSVTDDSGDRWTIRGERWGAGREGWSRTHAGLFEPKDEVAQIELEAACRLDSKRRDIYHHDWQVVKRLSEDQCDRILAILAETPHA